MLKIEMHGPRKVVCIFLEYSMLIPWEDGPQNVRVLPYLYKSNIKVWTAKDCTHFSEDSMPTLWEDGPQHVRILPYLHKRMDRERLYAFFGGLHADFMGGWTVTCAHPTLSI